MTSAVAVNPHFVLVPNTTAVIMLAPAPSEGRSATVGFRLADDATPHNHYFALYSDAADVFVHLGDVIRDHQADGTLALFGTKWGASALLNEAASRVKNETPQYWHAARSA